MLELAPLRRSNLSGEIAAHLRDQIVSGHLRPGARINLDEIADRLGVSRMPVRDAVLELAHEGLMHVEPRRRVVVAPLSKEDVLDAYLVHAFINGMTAERAALLLDKAQNSELAALHRRIGETSPTDVKTLDRLNWQLHRIINYAGQSTKLIWLLRITARGVPRHFYHLIPDWATFAHEQHAELLSALRDGDQLRAGYLARQHVETGGKMLIEFLDRGGFWSLGGSDGPV